MADNTGSRLHTYQKGSVAVKVVNADDSSIEAITISRSLLEVLVKDPVCGRSDYSDLPGVSRGVCSSWRSFAEFPRRTNTPIRYQREAPASSDQRQQKNYEAKIRREKLTLQRVAKRERLRAQQRERHKQQTLLNKLQDKSSYVVNSCLNTGVIISSPKKRSAKKEPPKKESPKKPSQEDHKKYAHDTPKKLKCMKKSKTLHREDVSWKPSGNSKKKINFDVDTFDVNDVHTRKDYDDVVSTTSAHHGDVDASQNSKTSLMPTVSTASQDKSSVLDSFGDREENPVTSSQDTQETSLKAIPSDTAISSMSTTCIVTSTTAPEIADADSSTTSTPGRNTRNVKRVDYTEMLDDEFDQDVKEKSFKESNSGRKIRPVKRTLEKAIVEASLKKSPRKRKIDVDTNVDKSGSQPNSASSSNTEAEGDKIKQIKNSTKKSAASTVHAAEKPSSFVSGQKQKQSTPKSVSSDDPQHSKKQSTSKSVSGDVSRHSKKQSTSKSVSGDVPRHSKKQSTSKSFSADVPDHSQKQSTPKSVSADVAQLSKKQSTPKSVSADVAQHSQKQSRRKSVSADVPQHRKKRSASKSVSADMPRQRQKQSMPESVSAEVPGLCLPASMTAISQSHLLCQSNTLESPLPADSAFVSSSLSNCQHNPSYQFVSNVAPSATLSSQPIVVSGKQLSHSIPLAHTTTVAPFSVRSPRGLQNAAITTSLLQKPLPSVDAQDTIRYPVSSLALPQANMQIHTSQALAAGIPSFSNGTIAYDMNYSMQPPDMLQEDQKFIPVPKRTSCSVSTYQPWMQQGIVLSASAKLTNTSTSGSLAYQQTSNTQLGSAVNAKQQQQISYVQKMMAENNLAQFLKSKQMNSGGSPTKAINRIQKGDAEVLSCKKQSQFDVETMLNSVQMSNISGKSIDHPNKLCYNETVSSQVRHQNLKNSNSEHIVQPTQRPVVAPRLTSQETPGLTHKQMEVQNQSQYVTFSQSYSQQEHSLSNQTGLLQPSFQSLENSQISAIGPPPPLISASELLNSTVSIPNPASLTYQISSGTVPRTKHTMPSRGTLPSAPQFILKKSSTAGDMTAQVESLMQRSAMTAKPSSASQHNVSSRHQQNMQPQPSRPALQYPDSFIATNKVKPMQPYSGRQQEQQFRQQDQRPRMPALVNFINNPHPTEGTQEGFQTNRPLVQSFTDKPAGYSVMTQTNLTSEQRVVTGIPIDQKPQVPASQQSSCQLYKSKPNILARHRLPSPRFTYRPDGTAVQQYNAYNQRKTAVINSRAPVSNPEFVAPPAAHTQHHWRPPLREGMNQYTRSQPAVGKQNLNQMLQKTNLADISQPQADLQSIQPGIYQQNPSYPKNYNNAKKQNAGTGMLHPFSIAEDQIALKQVSGMAVAKMLQSSNITSPSGTRTAASQTTNLSSSPQRFIQADKYAMSTSQAPTKTIPSSTANIVMYAMDLSKKTLGSGPKPIKIVITTVPACVTSSSAVNPSVTTTTRSPLKKPVTMLFASPVKPTVTVTSRLPQQKPVTVQVISSVNPSVTTASRLPQQKPVTVQVTSSVNPSITTASRLPGHKQLIIPVPSSVSQSVTTISRSPGQKPVTMYVTSSVNRPVTTVSSLPQGHSTTKANKAPEVACSYPVTRPQIKQEIMSQVQSEGETGHILRPDFRKSPSHMTEFTHVSTTASFALSSQNSIPARELSNGQLSHSVGNSRDCTTVSAPQMALPVMGNNPRSVEEHIKVKVEAHLSHELYSEQLSPSPATQSVPSSTSLPQPALFTRAPQTPVSASVTSNTAKPQLSNQPGTTRPSLAHPRVDGQHNVPPHQPMVMRDALPAHIRIKQEIHADTVESVTSVSSSRMLSTNSLMQATTDLAAQNKAADIVNKSIVRSSNVLSTLTDVSKSSLLPKQSVHSKTSTVESVLSAVAGNVSKNHLTSTQSTLTSHTFQQSADSHSRVASSAQYMNNPVNSTYGIRKHAPLPSQDPTPYTSMKVEQSSLVDSSSSSSYTTSENLLAKSSMCLAAVSQTSMPDSATISEAAMSISGQMPSSYSLPQLVNYSCDKYASEELAETQLPVLLPPSPSVASPNKQTIIGASPSRFDSLLDDPLFVWHTDSNKQASSFSLEDITNSLGYEQIVPGLLSDISLGNNVYTVTVSYPGNDNSNLLHCGADTSPVDMTTIKVEPTVQPVLNQREIIDLCLSDSEENCQIDAEASSFLQTEDSVDSDSQLTYLSKPMDAENVKASLSVTDIKDIHLSLDNFLQTDVSETSDHFDARSAPEKPVSGISKFAAKQIIKSPLTGHNVSVSGEHLSFIRKRLARISTDLMSFTSDIPESETSSISTKMTDRVLCDSEAPVCETEQSPLNASAAGAEFQTAGTSVNTSKNQLRRRLFDTPDVNTKRVSAARKRTHVEVKNEHVETISIDDDSNDEDFQQSSTTSDAHFSGISSTPGSIFSFPFGSSSAVLTPQKDLSLLSSSESSMMSPFQGGGGRLASIASWTNDEVAEWLKNHKLDRVCPNLKSLDGRGLQRMAFEHQRDPDLFYSRVKKTLGLTFFQTMVICHSMKELNDSGLDDC
ncbi:hypothetical protein BsWGS_25642 [Bradybaena similaris]